MTNFLDTRLALQRQMLLPARLATRHEAISKSNGTMARRASSTSRVASTALPSIRQVVHAGPRSDNKASVSSMRQPNSFAQQARRFHVDNTIAAARSPFSFTIYQGRHHERYRGYRLSSSRHDDAEQAQHDVAPWPPAFSARAIHTSRHGITSLVSFTLSTPQLTGRQADDEMPIHFIIYIISLFAFRSTIALRMRQRRYQAGHAAASIRSARHGAACRRRRIAATTGRHAHEAARSPAIFRRRSIPRLRHTMRRRAIWRHTSSSGYYHALRTYHYRRRRAQTGVIRSIGRLLNADFCLFITMVPRMADLGRLARLFSIAHI